MHPLGYTRVRALAALTALALVVVACSSESPAAVTVNGSEVSQSAVDRDFATILKNAELKPQLAETDGKLPPAFKAAWLTALIETEVAESVVRPAGTKITKDDRIAAQQLLTRVFGSEAVVGAFPKAFRDATLARYANVPAYVRTHTKAPSAAQVRESYDTSLTENCASRRLISHILVADEATAKSVAAEAAAGGDFAALVAKSSTDTQSGPNGGALGCSEGGLPFGAAFDAAAAALQLGQTSAPVQSQYGWHIIKVQDVEQGVPFDSVKSEIRRDLVEHGEEGQRKLLALMARAKVKVASRFGRWVVEDGRGSVQAPKSSGSTSTSRAGSTTSSTAPQP